MYFDIPKVVRSPGCDHEHDEESQNGRDMKIDILDDYIQTPEWFRGLSDIYRSTRGYRNPPEVIGPHGPKWWKRRGGQGAATCPSPQSPNWTRGAAPFSFSLSPSFLLSYSEKKRGILLGLGSPSRTPHPWRTLLLGRPPPPCSLIYRGRGHPIDATINH